jgi:hypothetical protein
MFALALRLHFRNKLALLYSYLFPTLFLLAFWVLYRYDQVPLVRHLGALLTVTVLGGACFGLPTTMVSERERGVWRRYRLAPVSAASLVGSTVAARYVLLLIAGLLQIVLAMALGMPPPRHPLDLFLAFTLVAFAFIGLGLVIAMSANTVPAVQALGQCVFLPMLIIGGIAVPLATLPAWAQRLSAYFPGRYSVEAIQATVAGPGLEAARFSAVALIVIGAAGCVAGARLFRWDAQQRVVASGGYGWIALALAAWIGVGLAGESRSLADQPGLAPTQAAAAPTPPQTPEAAPPADVPAASTPEAPAPPPTTTATPESTAPRTPAQPPVVPESKQPPSSASPGQGGAEPTASGRGSEPAGARPSDPPSGRGTEPALPSSWRAVTPEIIDRDLRFDRLPPDNAVVTPIAPQNEQPDTDVANHLEFIGTTLLTWKPAQVADPVQRVRNVLYVAAVPDVFQMEPLERYIPWVVFDHLEQNIPPADLPKILYWIAVHPNEGDDKAVDDLRAFRLGSGPADMEQTRERVALYAVKLLGRITGKIAR